MAQSTFSLSCEAHRNNLCHGFSVLQQNEEFVDMTVAADGHFVKVHQMVLALSSSYFKDLIASAGGRHPVIFLNKISYTTLRAILEYIYTGEVLISIEDLPKLIHAAKELHINGLEDMKFQNSVSSILSQSITPEEEPKNSTEDELMTEINGNPEMDDEICYFEVTDRDDTQSPKYSVQLDKSDLKSIRSMNKSEMDDNYEELEEEKSEYKMPKTDAPTSGSFNENNPIPTIQYTVSNQGSIQMILNRYMYYLKHSNRNNTRQWRCADYFNKCKCPAVVMTKDNIVRRRVSAHTHLHHDKRILKKVQAGAVYTAIKEAEEQGHRMKIKSNQGKGNERDPSPEVPNTD